MSETLFLDLVQKTLLVTLELSTPVLLISLVVGLIISLFQAVTQIQEATLTFVPKIVICLVTIVVTGPWMLNIFMVFVNDIYSLIVKLG